MQSHGITLSFYGEMADASGELVGPDGSAMPQVRAAHQFSADERRLDRLGIELI